MSVGDSGFVTFRTYIFLSNKLVMYKVFPSADNSASPKDILPTASKTALPPSSVGCVLSGERFRVGSVPALIPKTVCRLIPVIV